MHIRSHTGERRYQCEICEKRFIQPAALRSHMRTHTGERPFTCSMCPKSFGHATSLRQHMLSHGEGAAESIDTNGTSSTSIPVAPVAQSHQCAVCGKAFAYRSVLEAHLRVHSGEKPFQCPHCSKCFAQKATLAVHTRTHTGEKPYQCKFCDRTFAQYGSKSVHEKSHIMADLYKCPICDKSLSSPSALHTHKKTHGDRLFQCPMCPKNFTLSNYLKLHMKQVHSPSERCHQCNECGKTFAYQGSLQIHLRSHSGQKPFVCNVCSKGFASQGNLSSHMRIHTGVKPYVCKICGKAFAQRSQLNVHEYVHVEKRQKISQFTCRFCSKKFAYASSLYIHIRLHTGEKPYKCRFCDKRFTNQGNMRVHERVHTRERPYQCLACNRAFAQKVGLRTHMSRCPDWLEAQRFLTEIQRLQGDTSATSDVAKMPISTTTQLPVPLDFAALLSGAAMAASLQHEPSTNVRSTSVDTFGADRLGAIHQTGEHTRSSAPDQFFDHQNSPAVSLVAQPNLDVTQYCAPDDGDATENLTPAAPILGGRRRKSQARKLDSILSKLKTAAFNHTNEPTETTLQNGCYNREQKSSKDSGAFKGPIYDRHETWRKGRKNSSTSTSNNTNKDYEAFFNFIYGTSDFNGENPVNLVGNDQNDSLAYDNESQKDIGNIKQEYDVAID